MKIVQNTKFVSLVAALVVFSGCSSIRVWGPENEGAPESTEAPMEQEVDNEPAEIDTSVWQTYTNEEYGFSFDYPSDWQYELEYEQVPNDVSLRIALWPSEADRDYLSANYSTDSVIIVDVSKLVIKIEDAYTAAFGVTDEEVVTVDGKSAASMTVLHNEKESIGKKVYLPLQKKNRAYTFVYRETTEYHSLHIFENLLQSFNESEL